MSLWGARWRGAWWHGARGDRWWLQVSTAIAGPGASRPRRFSLPSRLPPPHPRLLTRPTPTTVLRPGRPVIAPRPGLTQPRRPRASISSPSIQPQAVTAVLTTDQPPLEADSDSPLPAPADGDDSMWDAMFGDLHWRADQDGDSDDDVWTHDDRGGASLGSSHHPWERSPGPDTPEAIRRRELVHKQRVMETHALDLAVAKYRKLSENLAKIGKGAHLFESHHLLLQWFHPLSDAIHAEQRTLMHARSRVKGDPNPGKDTLPARVHEYYLTQLTADQLAVITLHDVLGRVRGNSGQNVIRFAPLVTSIGQAVLAEIDLRQMRLQEKVARKEKKSRAGPDPKLHHPAHLTVIQVALLSRKRLDPGDKMLSLSGHTRIGALLMKILLDVAQVWDEEQGCEVPAFTHAIRAHNHKMFGEVEVHPAVFNILLDGMKVREQMHPRFKPMVVQPLPWSGVKRGGYLSVPSLIIRPKPGGHRTQLGALRDADLSRIYSGLNALGATPWVINHRVLAVVEAVRDEGGGSCAIPSASNLPLPPRPEDLDSNPASRYAWEKEYKRVRQLNADLHGLRADLALKLAVANDFKEDITYFPHNLDFRGRAYPIPPHLNHIGADVCRGLLKFAQGKALGDRGLYWLKVHLANLYGKDKLNFEGRIEFVDSHLEEIQESAENPLGPREKRWWAQGEDPWQVLAACMELSDALRHPAPELFVSNLTVHQDGSCNGLQHYAALGRDIEGAQAVDLLPSTTGMPGDVYSGVAEKVAAAVKVDAGQGHQMAGRLDGWVTRKIVKQTVMTSVYGVTFVGARDQIQSRLRELDLEMDERELFTASHYLAGLTLGSLDQMFSSARAIQRWLTDAARLVAETGQPVSWITPLGLPIVQPYRKKSMKLVKTLVQNVSLASREDQPVMAMRQASAFPPNYVHSLDSTHMLLTAMECQQRGLEFAAVHDSFWTHAATVDEMNGVIRRQFVEMYSSPLLDDLLLYFQQKHPDVDFPPLPERGHLDVSQILHSPFFFD